MNPFTIKSRLKQIATSRVGQVVIAALAGATVMYFFLPEKTIIKKETEIVYKDKIVEKEVIKYVDRVVEKEVIKEVQIKKVWTKTTFPDGKIVETEVYEENSQQVDRMRELEQERYKEQLAEVTREFQQKESYLKQTINAKHFSLGGGIGTHVDGWKDQYYYGQFTYDMWGPFQITGQATSEKQVGLGIAVKF